MSTAASIWAWIERNPDRAIYIVLTLSAVIARFAAPGSRWGAAVTSMAGDLVKLLCLVLGKPMPGGFSPAPAAIPATQDAVAKMPLPTPSERPGPKDPGIGTRISGLVLWSLAALSLSLGGCAWFQAHPQIPQDVAGITSCVADAADMGLDAKAIAAECGGLVIDDVIRLLEAKKKIEAKALAKHEAAPAPSSSACPLPVKP